MKKTIFAEYSKRQRQTKNKGKKKHPHFDAKITPVDKLHLLESLEITLKSNLSLPSY